MNHPSTYAGVGDTPVVYAGRFIDRVSDVDLPGSYVILGEEDVPARLFSTVDEVTALIILDLESFPLRAVPDGWWDVPLFVIIPSTPAAESLVDAFGTLLFERIEFFDRIVTPNSRVWEDLRRRYCWAESQRIEVETEDPGEAILLFRSLLETEPTSPATFDDDRRESATHYRKGSGEAVTGPVPQRAIHDPHRDLRFAKAVHRAQAKVLGPRFIAAREEHADDVPLDVLEVGTGDGRWAARFDLTRTRFSGVDASESAIGAARSNFPNQRFDLLGSDLLLPYDDEAFDLVFCVDVVQPNPVSVKRQLLSEMWRVARPAGRLLFLEDFVDDKNTEGSTTMSVLEFVDLIVEVTAGQVVLEHVESLRYPHDDLFRGGVISLLRLGTSKTR